MLLEILGMSQGVPRLFSAIPYTGTGGVMTLPTDVDATNGALTMLREVGSAKEAALYDTVRGASQRGRFASNEDVFSALAFSARNRVFTGANYNVAATSYVAWNFAKRAGFLDIVNWSGRGSSIAHSLGETPKVVLTIARTNSNSDQRPILWEATATADYIGGGQSKGVPMPFSALSSTHFTPDATAPNEVYNAAGTYTAYLFGTGLGHIYVGGYAGDGTANQAKTLPWAPTWTILWEQSGFGSNPKSGFYDVRLAQTGSFLTASGATAASGWDTTGSTLNTGPNMNTSGKLYAYMAVR